MAITTNRPTGIPGNAGCCRVYTIETDKSIYTLYQFWYYRSTAPDLSVGDHLKLRHHKGWGLYSISTNIQVEDDEKTR